MKLTITQLKCESVPQYYKNGKRKPNDKVEWHEEKITFDAKPVKGHEGLFYNPDDEIGRYVYDANGNVKHGIYKLGYSGVKDHTFPLLVTAKGELVRVTNRYGLNGPMGKAAEALLSKIL